MLEENFEKFLGYDGDPVIQSFRERGQDAVVFLARKVESKDLTSRVKAVKALRQMGPPPSWARRLALQRYAQP